MATESNQDANFYQIDSSNKYGWISLYAVTGGVGVLANLIFLIASAASHCFSQPSDVGTSHRRTANGLMISLALRDLLMSGALLPLALLPELVYGTWPFEFDGDLCMAYNFAYQCLMVVLPLSLIFLSWHLFIENCKYRMKNGDLVHPNRERIELFKEIFFLLVVWACAAVYAMPTTWWSEVVDDHKVDFYGNEIRIKAEDPKICKYPALEEDSNKQLVLMGNTLASFWAPMVLLIVPWMGLLAQVIGGGCCMDKYLLPAKDFRLALIAILAVVVYEASYAFLALFDLQLLLTSPPEHALTVQPFINFGLSWRAVMKWAIFLPSAVNPILFLIFSADAQNGLRDLCCSCFRGGRRPRKQDDSEELFKDPPKRMSMFFRKQETKPV